MEELGIGRPSTYAATLKTLVDREYVKVEKRKLIPDSKGRIVTAFLENFFKTYVEYDFTASLEEKLDEISDGKLEYKSVLRDFWRDFSAAIENIKDLRVGDVLEALNEELSPLAFPARADGSNPRTCPKCGTGNLSLKLGKFGAFVVARTIQIAATPSSLGRMREAPKERRKEVTNPSHLGRIVHRRGNHCPFWSFWTLHTAR